MRKIMTYTAASFHQLHLLFVDAHDGAVRVGVAFKTDDKSVAQLGNLVIIANTRHRTPCRYDISEVIQQLEYLLG